MEYGIKKELGVSYEDAIEKVKGETEKSFLADKEGEYDFVCTQYYRKEHMMHKGKFIVKSKNEK